MQILSQSKKKKKKDPGWILKMKNYSSDRDETVLGLRNHQGCWTFEKQQQNPSIPSHPLKNKNKQKISSFVNKKKFSNTPAEVHWMDAEAPSTLRLKFNKWWASQVAGWVLFLEISVFPSLENHTTVKANNLFLTFPSMTGLLEWDKLESSQRT